MNLATDAELLREFAATLGSVPAGSALTVLHIGASESAVAMGAADERPELVRMAVGTAIARRGPARNGSPTPEELEQAIAAIEDQIMPLSRRLRRPSVLVGVGAAVESFAHAVAPAGGAPICLTLDDVEHRFQQLAAVSQGRPAASSGLPAGDHFAGTLLLIREFMHHLGFESIHVARMAAPSQRQPC